MTILEDMENWARLLPPFPKHIPRLIKMKPETYYILQTKIAHKIPTIGQYVPQARLDAIPIVVVEDLEVDWIIFDQNGKEMKRAES